MLNTSGLFGVGMVLGSQQSGDQYMSIESLFSAWQGDGGGLYLILVIWCIRMVMKVRKEGKR